MRRCIVVLLVGVGCAEPRGVGIEVDPAPWSTPAAADDDASADPSEALGTSSGEESSSTSDGSSSSDGGESSGDAPEPPAACVDYDDPALFDATASFELDVIPILQSNCTTDVCHSSLTPAPAAGLRLGTPPGSATTPGQVDAVYAAVVDVPALKANMDLVSPGSPGASFLLAKAEYGDPTDCDEVVCKPAGCGVAMPVGIPPLAAADLRSLRTWIAAGAPR